MKKLYVSVLLIFLLFAGCDVREPEIITLMTWNVHNLFDGKDDGFEYPDFRQQSGWSAEKYMGRINSISTAIRQIEPLPDIIVFQEIESHQILEDLADTMPRGYFWSHFANNSGSAIGVGILSRFEIAEFRTHSISIDSITIPRPILEVRINSGFSDNSEFIVFACHWKSKIGGEDETEKNRRASVRVILRRIREIWEAEPDLGIVIAGDLNENYNEFFRRGSNMVTALLLDDPLCTLIAGAKQTDFIVITDNKPPEPVYFPKETIVLFSPWINDLPADTGTYFYKNNWETLDQFLISHHFFGRKGLIYKTAFIGDFAPFININGVPVPYNPRTGYGLSDHLPLLIIFSLQLQL
ncbi:MAG: endonuclease/exonuclease/phosphatase family protein [Treponema sp.]|nr:endonuclease/exonuclease/phosphatase family protein [Treponema sp.]